MTYPFPPIPERIQWHEGMLLAPQHFQQNQARNDALVAWQVLASAPLAWGVRRLEIDTGLLASGLLRIVELDAVLDDGTVVWHDANQFVQGVLELDLTPHAEQLELSPQDIWLTLPRARGMNVPGTPSRFTSFSQPPVDDEVSEAVAADLPRLRPTLALAVGSTPSSLWQSLRLGSVYKDNKQIRVSDDLPPLMLLPRTHPLWARCWRFATELRSKAAFVARQMQVPSSRAEDRLTTLEQRERLRSLLHGLAPFEAVLQTQPLHPYAVYLALSGLLGPLAMLRPGSLSMLPPAFDQFHPGKALEPLLEALEESIAEVSQEHLLQLFELKNGSFSLDILSDWVAPRLVLGLRGKPEKDLVTWMTGAVIGVQSAWASLRERRVPGAPRQRIESAPELGVRSSSGFTLFSIETPESLVSNVEALIVTNLSESSAAMSPQEIVLFTKG